MGPDRARRTAVTAAGFSESALLALTVPAAENTARAAGKRIGMAKLDDRITDLLTRRSGHQNKGSAT